MHGVGLWLAAQRLIKRHCARNFPGNNKRGNWPPPPYHDAMVSYLLAVACVLAASEHKSDASLAREQPPVAIEEVLSGASVRLAADPTVRVRGVVTGGSLTSFVIQDDTAAICVAAEGRRDAHPNADGVSSDGALPRGSDVVVEGRLDRGGYAPRVLATSVVVLGRRSLPMPLKADLDRLFAGVDNSILVEMQGLVRGYCDAGDAWRIKLYDGGRELIVHIPKASAAVPPEDLLDARINVAGIVGSIRNTRGEFLSPLLRVPDAAEIKVLEPPTTAPFDSPWVELSQVGRYRFDVIPNRRITTGGVVTCVMPGGVLFIQEHVVGMRVEHGAAEVFSPGDRVHVAGFVDMSRRAAAITSALIRRTGSAPLPDPFAVPPDRILRINAAARAQSVIAAPSSFDGTLITFAATVVGAVATSDGGHLVLQTAGRNVPASLVAPGFQRLEAIPIGSEVQVVGVVQCAFENPDGRMPFAEDPVVDGMRVLLRSPDDVTLLKTPPWWNSPRLLGALGATLATLAGVLAWNWALRRKVSRTTDRLADEMRSRHNAAIEFQATLRERNRLAGQLHDTLLQTLRGINFQLGACRVSGGQANGDASEHLDVARRMLNHAAEELRGSVWALRTVPSPGRSFAESLEAIARQTGHGHSERIDVAVAGETFKAPQFVLGNLLLVAQEAIQNSLAHAEASWVDVVATFDPVAGSIDLVVVDDGRGFSVGAAVGPDQGHFGITGMRERIERLGGTIAIQSTPGHGTTVRATVRRLNYDTRLAPDEHATEADAG